MKLPPLPTRIATEQELQQLENALDPRAMAEKAQVRVEAAEEVLGLLLAPRENLKDLGPNLRLQKMLAIGLVGAAVASLGGFAIYLNRNIQAPAPVADSARTAFVPLTREALNARIAKAVAATLDDRVIYEDVLGEGQGAWDPSPRYPSGIVNCILWIDQLISETYGAGIPDKTPIMDRIRYFHGQVGFGLRKHYIPHWLAIEPAPLKRVPLERYSSEILHEKVEHDFDHFRETHRYTCPLYQMGRKIFDIEYVSPDEMNRVAARLPAGYYLLFGVATPHYQKLYGANSGPMGLVHGILLEARPALPEGARVYHASISGRKVMNESLADYTAKMKLKLHRGYALYELDPEWNYQAASAPNDETLAIQKCEKALRDGGQKRSGGLK